MPAPERLRQQQARLAAHVRDPDHEAPPPGIEDRRLQVYRELFFDNVCGLLAGMFLQGMIYNGVSVAVNQQAAEWELREKTRMMGRLHATFYVGSMLSAFVSGALAASGLPLWTHMTVVGVLAAALHVWVGRRLPPETPGAENPSSTPIPAGAWQGLAVLAGMALSNALVGLAGALFAQTQGGADISMGVGTIVIGLAAGLGVILGAMTRR